MLKNTALKRNKIVITVDDTIFVFLRLNIKKLCHLPLKETECVGGAYKN